MISGNGEDLLSRVTAQPLGEDRERAGRYWLILAEFLLSFFKNPKD